MKITTVTKTVPATILLFLMVGIYSGTEAKVMVKGKTTTITRDELPAEQFNTVQPQEPLSQTAPEKAAAGELIAWQVISSGGIVNGTSADYRLYGTAGQVTTGSGNSNTFVLKHGFWQDFASGEAICCDTPGDANDDLETNIGDAVFIINHVFKNGPGPNCMVEGDANNDCNINVGDAVFLVHYCFNSGESPACGCIE